MPRQPETFLPLVAVTLGDPAGVGPEVVVRTWSAPAVHACCRPLVVGHPEVLCRALARFTPGLRMQTIGGTDEADPSPHLVPCLPVGTDDALLVQPGTVDPRGGQAAYEALVRAARLALAGQVQAICTGPLHKAALWEAGHKYPGHTEILAELCGVRSYAMMLYLGPGPQVAGRAGLGVVHATLHMALRDVFSALCGELIEERIALADAAFAQLLQASFLPGFHDRLFLQNSSSVLISVLHRYASTNHMLNIYNSHCCSHLSMLLNCFQMVCNHHYPDSHLLPAQIPLLLHNSQL